MGAAQPGDDRVVGGRLDEGKAALLEGAGVLVPFGRS